MDCEQPVGVYVDVAVTVTVDVVVNVTIQNNISNNSSRNNKILPSSLPELTYSDVISYFNAQAHEFASARAPRYL
jgi:hypothetical protein